jgi:hypothetical protein
VCSTDGDKGNIPTDKDLDIAVFRESGFEEFFSYITTSSGPFLGRFIEDIEYSEPLREVILQFLEFTFKKDIVLGDLLVSRVPGKGVTLP